MDVQVLAIEPQDEAGRFTVTVGIGADCGEYTIVVETIQLGDVEAQLIRSDDDTLFRDLHGHMSIEAKIRQLVGQRYYGRPVRLPAVVGKVTLPELAMSSAHK